MCLPNIKSYESKFKSESDLAHGKSRAQVKKGRVSKVKVKTYTIIIIFLKVIK